MTRLATTVDEAQGPDQAAAEPRLLLRPDEVAGILAVSPRTIGRLVSTGRLASVRVLGARRFRLVDVQRFVAGLGGED